MTAKEIFDVMVTVGFPPVVAVTMTAIALRESAGDPNAFNGNSQTGDRSYGLLQINMLDKDVAALINEKIPGDDEKRLLDPATNAKAGFLMWNNHNPNLNIGWYINRPGPYKIRYEVHLPEAQSAALGFSE